MLREVGIALFLAAVGLGAGDGFIDAIAGGGFSIRVPINMALSSAAA